MSQDHTNNQNITLALWGADDPKWAWIGLPLIIVISFFTLFPVLDHGFVWDDEELIVNNEQIKQLSFEKLPSFFEGGVFYHYSPITAISYALDFSWYQLDASGYHLTSLLIHLFNILLVYWVLMLLGFKWQVGFLATLIFAIHPAHAEAVAWLSCRSYLLGGTFFLLALGSYLKYGHSGNVLYFILALLGFALALLSSRIMVTFAPLLIVIDWYLRKKQAHFNVKPVWKSSLEKIPFFLLAIISGMISIQVAGPYSFNPLGHSFVEGLVFGFTGLIQYLIRFVFPIGLTGYHPYTEPIPIWYYLSPLLAGGVLAFWWRQRLSPLWFLGLGFFLITIAVTLKFNFLNPFGSYMTAERYTYIAYIGLAILAATGIWRLVQAGSWKRYVGMGLIGVLLILWVPLTWNAASIWKNHLSLWEDVSQKHPTALLAYNNLASYYAQKRDFETALSYCNKALDKDPDYLDALNTRAMVHFRMNQPDLALQDFNKVLALDNQNFVAFNNRGEIYRNNGEMKLAEQDFRKAIEINPNYFYAHNNLGAVAFAKEDYTIAEKAFKRTLQLNSAYIEAHINLGTLYNQQGLFFKTVNIMEPALSLNPKIPLFYDNLGRAYYNLQEYPKAIQAYSYAIKLQPQNAGYYYKRAIAHKTAGDKGEALADMKQAQSLGLKVDPSLLEALKE